jgi:hypothetical protein
VIGFALIVQQTSANTNDSSQGIVQMESIQAQSVDYEAIKISYHQRAQRLETLKAELYTCLCSIDWNQRFWDIVAKVELPHRAFHALQEEFGEEIISAFADHPSLVSHTAHGRLVLTRDAMSAWTRIQAEQVFSS